MIPPLPQQKKKKARWSLTLEGSRSSAGGTREGRRSGGGKRGGRGKGSGAGWAQGASRPAPDVPLSGRRHFPPAVAGPARSTLTRPGRPSLAKESSSPTPGKRTPIPRISSVSQLPEGAPLPRSQGRGLRGRRPAWPARSGVVYRPHRPTGFVPAPGACLYN